MMEDKFELDIFFQKMNISNASLMKFANDSISYPKSIYCFFEGEDYRYYADRIVNKFNVQLSEIRKYKCNNRTETIEALKLIEKHFDCYKYNIMFFVDHDYESTNIKSKLLFETDAYSIENYYANKETFKNILLNELGMNYGDNDYQIALNDFDIIFNEFNSHSLTINTFMRLSYINKSNICLDNFKYNSFLKS